MENMIKRTVAVIMTAAAMCAGAAAQPAERENFNAGWKFIKADSEEFASAEFNDASWRTLDLPHDWGTESPFEQVYPGETGKLAWWGQAWYRKHFTADGSDGCIFLDIDGAMSFSEVWCNGQKAGGRPYGYASYRVDLSPFVKEGDNVIAIRLDNPENSSRWYPGGGIYRNVWLNRSGKTGFAHWATFITTPEISAEKALVHIRTTLRDNSGEKPSGTLRTVIYRVDPETGIPGGEAVATASTDIAEITDGKEIIQTADIVAPVLWTIEEPALYAAVSTLEAAGATAEYKTVFGIRTARFMPDGFYLNGEKTFIKGVCLHHDSGALGAVWNETAWVRRLNMLKQMGCNGIRTAHNPPAPELLDLCDRMGFVVMDELTDTWTVPKKPNGYALIFDEWHERDLKDLISRDRNHPSVVLWSIGNEVGEQGYADKWHIAYELTQIAHREDPSRQTGCGNDNLWAASQDYRFTADVYGFNYKPHAYEEFHRNNPFIPFIGSETSSCVSTRGNYIFPVEEDKSRGWADFQVSSYDLYAPGWASKPDYEWFYEDREPAVGGEFVWTGFDYIGEPTPYNNDWSILTNFHDPEAKAKAEAELKAMKDTPSPSRSSYFGIIDLAGFPKDRYYLYQARWRPELPMAHILPHWTWPGREGKVTPVHVYTSGDSAELFINGKSLGMKTKGEGEYRLRWDEAVYEPGTVKVVAYKDGEEWATDEVRTAGPAYKIEMAVEQGAGPVGGFGGDAAGPRPGTKDAELIFVDVRITDSRGEIVPDAAHLLQFSITGPAEIVVTDAGDPTNHAPFYSHEINAFHGLATVVLRSKKDASGVAVLTVKGRGLKGNKIIIPATKR